uniref:DNA 3'-5' helicase II n=1 Tax=Candidatus Kentrum sp. MB TaxID=2138164 RepID=A0A450XNJ4_9GAMM|nr:MAG: Superfamily I DNA and RNA helicases [Candidatus Kentron sp. MB]VFK34391.1 MAG: Superfamily I DNA and RNA helicases [Candidatus Kentron sp. MB]VFK76493.1 MAG: Superfamily I DNA and RNA helicases [Candidatus Kentron sp. MB]
MVTIVQGATSKPACAQRLADFFARRTQDDGFLYIGYPIIGTAEGPHHIDALLVSKSHGLVVFDLIEGGEVGDFRNAQDDSYNKLESKLRARKELVKGRALQVPIHPVTFAPTRNDADTPSEEEYPVCNEDTLGAWLDGCQWDNSEYFEALVSVIQAISTIRKGRRKREVRRPDSRGAKLKRLEESIANLDNRQGKAVIETVDGVQRIRGLAGSGKTIVLALKAAYLHAQHPEWRIAVTFNTRSLKGQFRQFINTFTIEQINEEPDWENLEIIHAWGAPDGGDRDGLYYSFCRTNGVEYHDFGSAKRTFGQGREFDGACERALDACVRPSEIYDAILIDEAQDFPPSFLRLCHEMLKSEKRLVYAYDELQNLNSQSLPPPEEIFGKNPDGSPRVRFEPNRPGSPRQDVILEKCYRNSRPVLAMAHALGFGIYRTPDARTGMGLVQIFDRAELWRDVGYEAADGELADGREVTLFRTEDTSPKFLEDHSPIEDLIQFGYFNSPEEQAQWVASDIKQNLEQDELQPNDIVVINPDPLTTRKVVGPIRARLFEQGINSHLAWVDSSPDVFFDADNKSVTFTGIYRAKGNEAGMVYILNAQDCYGASWNVAGVRNRLFTAITRSKAWVRVLGIGEDMQALMREFESVKKNDFRLHFRYPTEEERKKLTIVNRDMTGAELHKVKKTQGNVAQLVKDLEEGFARPEDLDADQRSRLIRLLGGAAA